MFYTFTLPEYITEILLRNDLLGFDYPGQAIMAIIRHKDWDTRWDFSFCSSEDIISLRAFKSEIINTSRKIGAQYIQCDDPEEIIL